MKRYALVVGINRYPYLLEDAEGREKPLKTPASDAEAIARLLEDDDNFQVRRLPRSEIDGKYQVDPDKEVEVDELLDEITQLFLPEDDRDTALLFFAGHGLPKPLGNLKQILLATSHANPRRKQWHGILLRDLWDILEKSSVKEQIIWLDSCHSGELLEFKDSDLLGRVPGRQRFLIAASHSSEVAYQRLDGKHGVLSGALIEGLNPNRMPQNQWITDRKLADFVEEELKAYYLKTKLPQNVQIRRPDREIELVRGKSSANAAESTQPKTSIVPKIPFVLPPLDVSTFTGREEELQKLEDLLLNRQGTKICSIASLAGVGGIGKSALAYHFATIHQDDFPDGVIALRVDGKDLDAIARDFARRCGEEIDSEDERDASTIMQEVFAYRRMLLIFDNAEESSIRALRPGGDRCAVIVTTRDRGLSISLDIPKEGRINLLPLSDPEALRLLETLIGKERVAIEPEAACNLIELTGKLPLALQIIGAGLKLNEGRKLTDYVASLRDERKRLERIEVEGVEHLDLRACFSLSLKQLQPDKINFFACLSLCASDGFSRRTATATSGFNDEYDAQKYLDYLCRISLLNYAEVGENRFVFHSLIRLFARELLVDRGLEEEATARHAEFCINLVKSFNPNNSDIGVSIIGEEIDDIILAAEWLQKNEIADSDLAESLNDFFEDYGYWSKATHLMRGFQALAESREDWEAVVTFRTRQAKYFAKQNELPNAEAVLAPLPDIISRIENPNNRQRSEIKWLMRLGRIRQQQQLFDAAVNALQRGVTIAEELGEQDSLRKILDSLANVFKQQRKWDEAIDAFQRVVEIEQALNNRRSMAIVLNGLAGIFQQQGKLEEAAATFQRSVEISEALNDRRQIAIGLNGLAGIFQQQGKLEEAAATFQRSVEISEALNDRRSVPIGLNGLAGVLQQQGKLDEAAATFQRVVEINEALNDRRSVAIGLNGLAGILQQQGKLDEAAATFQQVVEISETLNDRRSVAIGLNGLAGVFQQQGKLDEAAATFQRVVEISEALNDRRQIAIGLNGLAGVLQQQGKLDEAAATFQRVVEISEALNDRRQIGIGLNGLAGIFQQQGKLDRAAATFQQVVEINEAFNDQKQVAFGLNGLAGIFQQQGKLDEAAATFQQVVEISEAFNDQKQVAFGLNGLAGIFQQQGKLDEAAATFQQVVEISEAFNDQKQVAFGLHRLAGIFQQQGKLDRAAATFQQVVEISETLNDQKQVAFGLHRLAGIFQQQGKLDRAAATFQRVVEISETLNDQKQVAFGLHRLAGIFQQQGKLNRAAATFQRVVEINEALNDRRSVAIALNGLAGVFQQQDKLDEAATTFQRSVAIEEKFGNQPGLTMTLTSLSGVLRKQGRLEETIETLERIAVVEKELDNQRGEVIALTYLSRVLREQGRHEEAIQTLDRIFAIDKQLDNQQQQVMTLIRLGAVSQKQGNLNDARDNFERSLELSKEIGDRELQMLAMSDLGGLLHNQGCLLLTKKESWNEAEEVLRRSQDIFEELDDFRNLAMVLNSLGGLLRKQGKWKEAETMLRYGYNLAEKLKDKRGQAIILNSLGQVLSQQQDPENFKLALMSFRESIKLGQELPDQPHLAKVYTAMGQALLKNRETEQAVIQLIQGFEIDESLTNRFGLGKVTPQLTDALVRLGKRDEALAYCQRALAIDPKNRQLQELCDRLSSPNPIKKGTVKHIRYNT